MKFKRILAVFTAMAMAVSVAGCGAASSSEVQATPAPAVTETPAPTETPESAEGTALRVAGLKGPTTMGLINLVDDVAQGESDIDLDFTMYGAADEIVPLLVKGELDAAAVPANLAATLYQKTEGAVQVAAITPWASCTSWKTPMPSTRALPT